MMWLTGTWTRNRLIGYAAGAAFTILAVAVRSALQPYLRDTSPYIVFYFSTLGATVLFGWRAGAFSAALGLFCGLFAFVYLPGNFSAQLEYVRLALNAAVVACVVYLADAARDRINAAARQHLRWLATKRWLETTLENTEVGVAHTDRDGRLIHVTGKLCQILGRAGDDLLGKTLSEVLGGENAEDETKYALLMSGKLTSYRLEKRVSRPDGAGQLLEITRAVYAADGPAQGVNIFQDITERKAVQDRVQQLNKELAERNAQLDAERLRWKQVVEGIAEEVWISDAEGRMSLVNVPQVTHMGLAEFEGKWVEQVLEDVEILNPDGNPRPAHDAPLLKALQGRIVRGDEIMRNKRTGKTRWRHFSAAPIRDASSLIIGSVAVVHDINDSKEAERELQQTTELLKAITENTPDCIYVKDREGKLLLANPATLRALSKSAGEVIGKIDADFLGEKIGVQVMINDRRVIDSGQTITVEEVVPSADGTPRTYLSLKCPYHDNSGKIIGLIGISRDITDRKRVEEEQKEAAKRKDEFLATLAHELRNPLAPIRNGLELIKLYGDKPQLVEEARKVAERQLGHLVRLVDDLLEVSRISRGKIELRRELLDLRDVVRESVEMTRPYVAKEGHEFVLGESSVILEVNGDRIRLSQIVSNLLINAFKFTPPPGRIELQLQKIEQEAVITVRDSGIGMTREMLPIVFDLFSQAHKEMFQGGLGIGLSLVKSLVALHGGTVSACSAGLGKGSSFEVRLPLAGAGSRQTAQAVKSAARQIERERHRVLVVDDNVDAAELLASVLAALGHETATAYSGADALMRAKDWKPDTILLDIGMPGMNGYEAAKTLRSTAETKDIVLIALTGWGQEEDRAKAKEAGFDHHLVKPAEADVIEEILRHVPVHRPL